MSHFGTTDFGLENSLGKVTGYSTINKFGEATDCDNGVATDIWDGADGSTSTDIWSPPTAARTHQFTSTSANDAAAGTGMRTCRLYGLKTWTSSGEESEDITLNGTANVATANTWVIIYRIKGLTWGTGGVNAGTITATADTDATVTATILAGNNQTQMCIYAVPSTQKLRLTCVYASLVKNVGTSQRADGELLVMIDPATNVANNTAWTNKESFLLVEAAPPWSHYYDRQPKKLDGPCIVKIQVTANANNSKCIGGFDGAIVDN